MEDLIHLAKQSYPDFDDFTIQRQYDILKRFEPRITPEDLVYHYDQQYCIDVKDESWNYYLQNYME